MKRFFLLNIITAAAVICLLRLFFAGPEISRENGLLENLQAAFLGVEMIVLAIGGVWWSKREDAGIGALVTTGLLSVFLRELDIERLPVSALLVSLGSGTGRNLLLGLLWLAVVVVMAKRRAFLRGWIREGVSSPWGWGLLLGGGTYLLAAMFDQKVVPLPKTERFFWEEALETAAAIWLGLGALLWAFGDRPGHENRTPRKPD